MCWPARVGALRCVAHPGRGSAQTSPARATRASRRCPRCRGKGLVLLQWVPDVLQAWGRRGRKEGGHSSGCQEHKPHTRHHSPYSNPEAHAPPTCIKPIILLKSVHAAGLGCKGAAPLRGGEGSRGGESDSYVTFKKPATTSLHPTPSAACRGATKVQSRPAPSSPALKLVTTGEQGGLDPVGARRPPGRRGQGGVGEGVASQPFPRC